jgi:hypothetical protein
MALFESLLVVLNIMDKTSNQYAAMGENASRTKQAKLSQKKCMQFCRKTCKC